VNLHLDPKLPLAEKEAELREAILNHPVVIVAGETGSGKSTQLPKLCLSLFKESPGFIGHTQPRRLAARAIAERLCEETQTVLGDWVGYKIRFQDKIQSATRIKLMTDGILLAEIEQDPLLKAYRVLIIDEAHERSLNIDFLLGYLKGLIQKRRDLKIIITSATLDHQKFANYFERAPLIEVQGRNYPVEIRYAPLWKEETQAPQDLYEGVLEALQSLMRLGSGDILIFFATEREIRECHSVLIKAKLFAEILPLYSRLSQGDQQKVFHSRGAAKNRFVHECGRNFRNGSRGALCD